MDPGSNLMQPGFALMATLTSGLLGQPDTRPRQPSSAVWALGHGSHLTPVGPRPTGLLLVRPRHSVPVVAPFGPSYPSRTLTPTPVDPNNRASSSPDPTPVLTDPCPLRPSPSGPFPYPSAPQDPSDPAPPLGRCSASGLLPCNLSVVLRPPVRAPGPVGTPFQFVSICLGFPFLFSEFTLTLVGNPQPRAPRLPPAWCRTFGPILIPSFPIQFPSISNICR